MGTTEAERQQALIELRGFRRESSALRESLQRYETMLEHVGREVENGVPLHEVMTKIGVATNRLNLLQRLTRFEDARHRMRVACFRLSHAEGLTISDIARLWGISRQLAARFIKESLTDTPKPDTSRTGLGALPVGLQQLLPEPPPQP